MQKFTDFIIEHASVLENKSSEDKAIKFQDLYEAKLKEMGAKSPMDLDENQSEEFFTYLKSLKEIKETTEEVVEAKAEVEEHHTADPTDKYEVRPCDVPGTPFAVYEGDVRVECFETKEEAQAYADKQNKEQGLGESKVNEDIINEKDVTDEKSFRAYAESVLKKAHPDDYDEKIANKVIDGIASKVKDDNWGEAVGRLTSGLGS
tara:strand:- start:117 stop:731 length:615 start_codon:yes stop_codon:yes gene_type:complete